MKNIHHNMDNYEQSKKAFSYFSTLFYLLKSNLLFFFFISGCSNSHKWANQTSTEFYNPHDEKCAFYQHLSLLSLSGLFDVKYTPVCRLLKGISFADFSFQRNNADTTKPDQISQPQSYMFTIWCTININKYTFIFITSVRIGHNSQNSWEDEQIINCKEIC